MSTSKNILATLLALGGYLILTKGEISGGFALILVIGILRIFKFFTWFNVEKLELHKVVIVGIVFVGIIYFLR